MDHFQPAASAVPLIHEHRDAMSDAATSNIAITVQRFLCSAETCMWEFLSSPARMQFCEPPLDFIIRHPADTWTNIGPFLAGLWVVSKARHALLRFLGGSAIWMGAASAYFHASDTLLGEALDLHGMFLFVLAVAILQQASQGQAFDSRSALLACLIFATITATAFLFTPWLGTPVFAVVVLMIVLRQWRTSRLNRQWLVLLATFAIAWLAWWLDYLHILCAPRNHILTGHGVWHLLNGVVVWQVYGLFERLDDPP